MRALVTGTSGFVGAAVARRLVAGGHDIRVLMRPTSDRRNIDGLKAEVVEGDLSQLETLKPAVAGCDAVFHVAADYRLWVPDGGASMYRANVDGTRDLIRAAMDSGVGRFVYTSSVAVLGAGHKGDVRDEASRPDESDMVSHYKRSKFLAEKEVDRLVAEEGAPVVIVNPSAPFGPRDIKPTPTGRIVIDAAKGRMPAYLDTGLNAVHVDDVADGHMLAFEKGDIGERYILGGENLPLRDLIKIVTDHAGRPGPWLRLPRAPLYPVAWVAEGIARVTRRDPVVTVDALKMAAHHMFYSSDKAKQRLGYAPRTAREALTDAVDWYQENGYLK
ncbi:MAG: NAD-dependent dehydratase [Rhodospirillaceae bacterium]|nr:NAD-dependent dehydratase [Rhodospirillaceae bacterium]